MRRLSGNLAESGSRGKLQTSKSPLQSFLESKNLLSKINKLKKVTKNPSQKNLKYAPNRKRSKAKLGKIARRSVGKKVKVAKNQDEVLNKIKKILNEKKINNSEENISPQQPQEEEKKEPKRAKVYTNPHIQDENQKEKNHQLHPSNYRQHHQPLNDDSSPHQKLVEQRNVDYSYDNSKISFFERVVNLDFIDHNPGYKSYIKDCKVQIKVARELRSILRKMPFRGSVDVPFTHTCKNKS